MKSISIAMATYNGARFISEQLESLAQQAVLPDELVVVDDGSTDKTLEIVRTFAKRAPFPVRVEKNRNRLGHRANFMKAARLCRSDLVAFCDQDDVWDPEKLRSCRSAFEIKDALLVYHNATVTTENLEPVSDMKSAAAKLKINPALSLGPWEVGGWGFTIVIDRFLLGFHKLWTQSADMYDTSQKEKHDQWFFFLASCLGSIAYLDTPLALYRQHDRNAVGYRNAPNIRGTLEILFYNDLEGMKSRMIASRSRAAIMEQLRKNLHGQYRARAGLSAAGYRRLEASDKARCEIYATRNMISRSFRLVSLSRKGGYRPRHQWGVGRKALIRDIIRGVFFPSRKHYKNRKQYTA